MRFRERAYSYDDVLMEPQGTDKKSRFGPDISTTTQLTRRVSMEIPIIASNMDTVTEHSMMVAMNNLGGAGILHRFMEHEQIIEELGKAKELGCPRRIFSIGLDEMNVDILRWINKADVATGVCIDVAHGDCKRVMDLIYHIGQTYQHWDKIVGNVATREGVKRMCIAGADAVKVGVGPGSLCTTRIITGCGVPQLSAVIECAKEAKLFGIPVIADGGIRSSGDISKAIAAGAASVMVGGLVAGTDETPGEIEFKAPYRFPPGECGISWEVDKQYRISRGEKAYKKYQGMASRDAMTGWLGGTRGRTPEGESRLIEYRGPVEPIIQELVGGLRSSMTYLDAGTLQELHENAVFIPVTPLGYGENGAHGLK